LPVDEETSDKLLAQALTRMEASNTKVDKPLERYRFSQIIKLVEDAQGSISSNCKIS